MTKDEAKQSLEVVEREAKALAGQSREIAIRIGELALKGDLSKDEKASDELRKLIQDLQQVNDRLTTLESFMNMVKGWIEGQNESLPIMANDIAALKRATDSNYVQFQWKDTDETGKHQHSFMLRRVRFGGKWKIDANTESKITFDVATGSNQTAAELKDAILTWTLLPSDVTAGTKLSAGQFSNPLGYEIARSSSEREFPERAKYNRTMWDGERIRGAMIEHGVDKNTTLFAGVSNSLSVKDTEGLNLTPGQGGRMSGFAGFRYETPNAGFGVSFWNGKRPETAGGAPEVTRQFIYANAEYIGLIDENVWLRAEGMQGRDRIPGKITGAQDMDGYHVILGYTIDQRNQFFTKFSDFDPNKDVDINSYKEYGLGYRYYINPGAMFTTTYEVVEDQSKARVRFNSLTMRYQYKF